LENLPFFLQKMIRTKVDQAAHDQQLDRVSLELMDSLRSKRFGNSLSVFPFQKRTTPNP